MGGLHGPPEWRFKRYIDYQWDTGCWIWTGGKNKDGYGTFFVNMQTGYTRSHTWAYMHFIGPIGDGLELDHLCRNRACCNPHHLEPVTHKENTRRGDVGKHMKSLKAQKTHCPKGHPYSGDNLKLHPVKGYRMCRECIRVAGSYDDKARQRYYARKAAKDMQAHD